MQLARIELLQLLDSVQYGISSKEVLEQSSCFVFRKGSVETFNEDVYCRVESPLLKDVNGAVVAKPLLELLRKIPDEEIELLTDDSTLILQAKKKVSKLILEQEIRLPVENVEPAKNWLPLHEDFLDGIGVVADCAATKEDEKFCLCCVHVYPEWVEGCDNYQLARYYVDTGFKKPCLLKAKYLKHIVALGMQEVSNGTSWVHFRNAQQVQFSIRKYLEEYPNFDEFLDVEGTPLLIPKNMTEAIERAEIFLQTAADEQARVKITLKNNTMSIVGESHGIGSHREIKKIKYDGRPVSFTIGSKILADISKKFYECKIGESKLKIDNDKWEYVACLEQLEG